MNRKITSIIIICLFTLCLFGCGNDKANKTAVETGTNVTICKVENKTIEKSLEYTGEAKAETSASVSSKVSGNIVSINANIGEYVDAGAVLASVDSSQYQQAYSQASAAYNQALAALEIANAAKQQAVSSYNNVSNGSLEQSKLTMDQNVANAQSAYDTALDNYNRQYALFEIGAISQVALDTAKTNLDTAQRALDTAKANAELNKNVIAPQTIESSKAAIQQADANIAQAKAAIEQARVALDIASTNLNNCTITAPISGYIASNNASIGQLASPGIELFSIQNSDNIDIEFNVTESVISSIQIGTDATIDITSANIKGIKGTVSLVSEIKDKNTGMYTVKISAPNENKEIKVGMLANISIITEKANEVLAIDYNALIQKNEKSYVYVAEGDNAVLKEITIGVTDGKIVEIISGLQSGEKVIVEGKEFLSDKNTKIKITN